jgi:aspartyl-tRNA(Asn)/glutamyl-tRNA(Gln) amidotransferase subunit B
VSAYDVFIGLEIHIHLLTKSKMFCACANRFGDEPNANVCPVCLGHPGVLPAVNAEAMGFGYRVSRALGCRLSPRTLFARKNYFYPDMPKNYQISQFRDPVGLAGVLEIPLSDGSTKAVRIRDCHLEEDAGKMIHAGDLTLLDYNRAGVPLLEVVTEPDLATGQEAEDFLRYFQRLVRYLGVCDGNMEEGSLRCDANISLNLPGAGLGSKVEIKNLNSSRFVKLAMQHEVVRQAAVLDSGGRIPQETRLWNENRDATAPMRSKEDSHDYRYFPEPDLPPFCPDAAFLAGLESSLVELPLARKARLEADYGLDADQAEIIHEKRASADYFEAAVAAALAGPRPAFAERREAGRAVALMLTGDLKKELKRRDLEAGEGAMTAPRLAALVGLVASGRISGKLAKQVLPLVFDRDADPEAVVKAEGWETLADPAALKPYLDELFAREAAVVAAVRSGDAKKTEYLIGRLLAATGGRADPALARRLVAERIAAAPADAGQGA